MKKLLPQVKTSPKEVTTPVCAVPQATVELFVLFSEKMPFPDTPITLVGTRFDAQSPCPSCPFAPSPHVYISASPLTYIFEWC